MSSISVTWLQSVMQRSAYTKIQLLQSLIGCTPDDECYVV